MRAALLRLNAAVFIWGFTGVLGRAITLNGAMLVWWRLFITAVSLWVLFYFTRSITRIKFADFLKIGLIGFVLAIHWVFFYSSIKQANVSIALTCLSTTGLFSAIIEPVFFRRRINMQEVILGLFALAGITVIYLYNLHFSAGIYLGLISSVATVVASVLNKKIVSGYQPHTITLYQLTGGFLGLTLLMPLYNYFFPVPAFMPGGYDWLWLIILSWCCTILTFILYISALKTVSAFTVNLLLTLEPVYGIILAFALYHENEQLHSNFYFGFALICMAVLLQMVRIAKQQRKTKRIIIVDAGQ
ncbi:MAG TPA: EamA family transporter [Chitinophagaceae bacterium]|nr:EamA family transporter [Chitinophagaceae bacterium]